MRPAPTHTISPSPHSCSPSTLIRLSTRSLMACASIEASLCAVNDAQSGFCPGPSTFRYEIKYFGITISFVATALVRREARVACSRWSWLRSQRHGRSQRRTRCQRRGRARRHASTLCWPRAPAGPSSSPRRLHHLGEAVEEVAGVVRTGRGLGVILHREHRELDVAHALARRVVEVLMGRLPAAPGERGGIDG